MSWGKIYCDTNWGENKYRTAGSIINEATPDCFQFPEFVSFKDHVRSEGATYEKMQCGIDILLFLGRSISITPKSPDNPTFSGILDTYTGATAGYSTRRLTNTYTGGLIRVRRSSDDAEQDIGYDANGEDLDISGLLAFVNADVNQYTSDFSSTEDLNESNGTGAAAQSIGGVDDAYKFTLSGGSALHQSIKQTSSNGGDFSEEVGTLTFDYYLPSGQTMDNIFVGFVSGTAQAQTTTDAWTSVSMSLTAFGSGVLFFRGRSGGSQTFSADGDVFYLKNIVVTQTTADGAVTTWYDQTGNGNHATNSTASEQPLIVEGGDIIYEGATISRPAVEFDGVDDLLETSNVNFGSIVTIFLAAQSASFNDDYYFDGQSANNRVGLYSFSANSLYQSFTTDNSGSVDFINSTNKSSSGSNNLLYLLKNGASSELGENGGAADTGTLTTDDFIGLTIGARFNGVQNYSDRMREMIIYSSDQSSNRTGIEGNIDNYFRITS